jgi:hypothetical protein
MILANDHGDNVITLLSHFDPLARQRLERRHVRPPLVKFILKRRSVQFQTELGAFYSKNSCRLPVINLTFLYDRPRDT